LLTPTQTKSFSFQNLDQMFSVQFDGFDDSLGKLMSVHWSFQADATLNNAVVNIGDPTMVGDPSPLSAIWDITVSSPVGLSAAAQLTTPGFTGMVPSGGPTQVGTSGVTPISGMAWIENSDPVTLAAYIGGANSVSIDFHGEGTQGGSVPNTVFSGNNGNALGTVSLYYDYEMKSIPEPLSLGLFGLGLAGLAASRRRKLG
jgi:hypothetical protein